MLDAKAPRKTMRKVRCERAARAVPVRTGTGESPSTTASSISSMETAPSSAGPPGAARSGGGDGTAPWYGDRAGAIGGLRAGGRAQAPALEREVRGGGDGHVQHGGRPDVALHLVDAAG